MVRTFTLQTCDFMPSCPVQFSPVIDHVLKVVMSKRLEGLVADRRSNEGIYTMYVKRCSLSQWGRA